MNHRINLLLRNAVPVLALLIAGSGFAAPAEPLIDIKELEKMAKASESSSQFAAVAKQYRLRAEAFDAKARKHEEQVRKLSLRPLAPIELKWPAMARQDLQRERRLAVQARRAAQESWNKADKYLRRVIETEFTE